jgi:hypothetical protein
MDAIVATRRGVEGALELGTARLSHIIYVAQLNFRDPPAVLWLNRAIFWFCVGESYLELQLFWIATLPLNGRALDTFADMLCRIRLLDLSELLPFPQRETHRS